MAATVSTHATAAMYKCTDASGKTSYSEKPCPGAASEQRIQTDGDVLEKFLRQLHAIATYRTAWDVELIERTLGVRLQEGGESGPAWYRFVSTPPGFPVAGGVVRLPAYGQASLEVQIAPGRCVSPEMVKRVFGTSGANDANLNYYVKAVSPYGTGYATNVNVVLDYRKRDCVRGISMRQDFSGDGGRRRYR